VGVLARQELEALSHTPYVHDWEIKGGDDIYGWTQQDIEPAGHVLCVIFDEYMKGAYSTLERNGAHWGIRRNIPASHSSWPLSDASCRRCLIMPGVVSFLESPRRAAWLRPHHFMQKSEARSGCSSGKVFAVSNIPTRVNTWLQAVGSG
jgi:hypothetical protein